MRQGFDWVHRIYWSVLFQNKIQRYTLLRQVWGVHFDLLLGVGFYIQLLTVRVRSSLLLLLGVNILQKKEKINDKFCNWSPWKLWLSNFVIFKNLFSSQNAYLCEFVANHSPPPSPRPRAPLVSWARCPYQGENYAVQYIDYRPNTCFFYKKNSVKIREAFILKKYGIFHKTGLTGLKSGHVLKQTVFFWIVEFASLNPPPKLWNFFMASLTHHDLAGAHHSPTRLHP